MTTDVPIALLPIASQAQAEAGTSQEVLMDALRTAQAISKQGGFTQIAPDLVLNNNNSVDVGPGLDADITFDNYNVVRVGGWNVVLETNATNFYVRSSNDGGSNFRDAASDYGWVHDGGYAASGGYTNRDLADYQNNQIRVSPIGIGADSGESFSFELLIIKPTDSTLKTIVAWDVFMVLEANSRIGRFSGAGQVNTAEDNDAFRLLAQSNRIESGVLTFEGK